jgi:prevent-host-death family protein
MARMAASKAREDFSDILNRVAYKQERIILHRWRRDVAALVSVEDLVFLEQLENYLNLEKACAALAKAKEKGIRPRAALMEELGLPR